MYTETRLLGDFAVEVIVQHFRMDILNLLFSAVYGHFGEKTGDAQLE